MSADLGNALPLCQSGLDFSRLREHDAAAGALEEPDFQARLERGDLSADAGLGQPKRERCAREAVRLRNSQESIQLTELDRRFSCFGH